MIIDGKKIKGEILESLKQDVSSFTDKPKLVVIQVGDNDASNVYINQKRKMCELVGFAYYHEKLEDTIKEDDLLKIIDKYNKDDSVSGILIQMPIPKHLNEDVIQNAVVPEKDVDGLSDLNAGMLMHNKDSLYSCTPYGVMKILEKENINVCGKHAVVVGRSNLVGRPMAMMLLNAGATVTICHSKTIDLKQYTQMADILVVAVGKSNFITGDMVKEGAVVIDVGINRVDGKLTGDVDFDSVKEKAAYITPVPGGVGQLTVAMLGENVKKAYVKQRMMK